VISLMSEYTHAGSRRNLLGEDPSAALVESLSNDLQVTSDTPPAFLFHTGEDSAVPVQNSLAFYSACVRAGVPAELHVYQYGPHGVGLAEGDPVAATWKQRLADWLRASRFLAAVERAGVEGSVQVGGEPLRWGMITFVPAVENAPSAFAMISRGTFRIPISRGAAVGECSIEVRDLGAVEPQPTIEDVRRLDGGDIRRTIVRGENVINLQLDQAADQK
jgi:hypothetical protein